MPPCDSLPDPAAALRAALRAAVRARGNREQLARAAGLSRQGLAGILAPGANPRLRNLLALLRVLGLRLAVVPAHWPEDPPPPR